MTLEPHNLSDTTPRVHSPEALGFNAGAREVLAQAFPVIIATASGTLMGFVDFWMVSRLGVNEAAAISPSSIIVFTFISLFAGILSCTNTFVSQSFGRRDYAECSRYVWQGLWISAVVGVGAMALWPVAPGLFRALNHAPALQPLETVYFQWRLPSLGSIIALTALTSFFQGIRLPSVTMAAAIAANALNVFFNWVFIYGHLGSPAMGVAGAALGTVLASWGQFVVLLCIFLAGRIHRTYGSRTFWRVDAHRMGRLFHVGIPAGLSWLLDVGTWGIFMTVIIGKLGTLALASSNMAMQCLHMSFMPTVGLGIAITALVGQNVGRRDVPMARARARTGLLLGMAYMALMGLFFLLFREPLIGLFVKRGDPDAAEIIRVGGWLLIFAAAFQVFDAIGIVCSSALKGAGDTRFPAVTTIVIGVAVFLPLCWLLTFRLDYGVVGAWLGATIYILALGVAMLWRWRSRAWENINIFRKRAVEPAVVAVRPTPYEPGDEISGG